MDLTSRKITFQRRCFRQDTATGRAFGVRGSAGIGHVVRQGRDGEVKR